MDIDPTIRKQAQRRVILTGILIILGTVLIVGVSTYFTTKSWLAFVGGSIIVIPLMIFGLYKGYKQGLRSINLPQAEKMLVVGKNYLWLGRLAMIGIVITIIRIFIGGIRGQDIMSIIGDIVVILICIYIIFKVKKTKQTN